MAKQFQYRCDQRHREQLDTVSHNMGATQAGAIKDLVDLVYCNNQKLETISRVYGMSYKEIMDALIETAYEEIVLSTEEE